MNYSRYAKRSETPKQLHEKKHSCNLKTCQRIRLFYANGLATGVLTSNVSSTWHSTLTLEHLYISLIFMTSLNNWQAASSRMSCDIKVREQVCPLWNGFGTVT